MSLYITDILPEQHGIPGLGTLQYLYNQVTAQMKIFHEGKEIAEHNGINAMEIYKRINNEGEEASVYELVLARKVKAAFGRELDELREHTRVRNILEERQICMWFLRKTTVLSFAEIAGIMGGFDHATAMNAVNQINNLIDTDRGVQHKVQRFMREL